MTSGVAMTPSVAMTPMKPLVLSQFTATSCIGSGVAATLASLVGQRSGLKPCDFETVKIDTHIGEVAGVDAQSLPANLQIFDCRNNRLAELAVRQDGLAGVVAATPFGVITVAGSVGDAGRRKIFFSLGRLF